MKRSFAVLCALGLGCAGRPARALEARPGPDRSGLYFRARAGVGYTSGRYEFTGLSATGFPPEHELTLATTLHGPEVGVHVAGGFGVLRGVALALEGGLIAFPVFAKNRVGQTSISGGFLAELGPLVDVYPWLDEASHLELGVTYARASFFGSTNDLGSADNIVELEPVSGVMIRGGAGYDFSASFGLTVRGSFGFFSGEHSEYKPGAVLVEAAYVAF